MLFDNGIKSLVEEGVDPEGETRAHAMGKDESCQRLVLVHNHIAVLEDEVQLKE